MVFDFTEVKKLSEDGASFDAFIDSLKYEQHQMSDITPSMKQALRELQDWITFKVQLPAGKVPVNKVAGYVMLRGFKAVYDEYKSEIDLDNKLFKPQGVSQGAVDVHIDEKLGQ